VIRAVAVVVPARNERALIGRCLAALAEASELSRNSMPAVSIHLIVVADACTDETAALARSVEGVEVIEITAGAVGSARAAGALRAVAEFCGPLAEFAPDDVWIANTDADSVVPAHWIVDQVTLADSGADLVLGTVRPDPADLTAENARLWHEQHVPVAGLPAAQAHIYGANLGIRASHYLRAGGFAALAEHEDVELVTRARQAGSALVATDSSEVTTSGRRHGRTPGGFARYLRVDLHALAAGSPATVPDAAVS